MNLIRLCVVFIGIVYSTYFFPIKLDADDKIVSLIDQLIEIESPDTGYSEFFSGSNFLPYEGSEQLGTLIIGATNRESSPVLRKIVESGFNAVPELMKHLNDKRKIKLPPIESGGFMWIKFSNEYDFNRATTAKEPIGVNLELRLNEGSPKTHEITVGDLCYVALGQILNRNWCASHYQPTGGRIISSPTYSAILRQVIIDEWGNLDQVGHRAKLIEDFRKPDSVFRVVDAYLRLSLYYPETVEGLVSELLKRPIPDGNKANEFLRQYIAIDDSELRNSKLEEFLTDQGQHYRDFIREKLFDELWDSHTKAQNGIAIDEDDLKIQKILHESFDCPEPVRYEDRKRIANVVFDAFEIARIIESLTHDDSMEIGKSVQAILESERFKNDVYMVEACLKCLASRSPYGDYLAGILERLDFQTATQSDLSTKNLEAIATSKSPAVQKQLQRITQLSKDPGLFFIAANAIEKESWIQLVERAKELLIGLPPDTDDGGQLLQIIVERSPSEAESILVDFLIPNTPSRCNTVCNVLWEGSPLSCKVLLPLLDDERPLPKYKMLVCDRAAQALSHSIDTIRFDSDWLRWQKIKAIQEMKDYCKSDDSP